MPNLSQLKAVNDRKQLAYLLGFKPSTLSYVIYKIPPIIRYTTFEIKKKHGGIRIIKSPNPALKRLQSSLSRLLYQCLEDIELLEEKSGHKRKPLAFGFRPKLGIEQNAAYHKGRRWVLNLDLENFFTSFNFGRVRGFFLKDKYFKLNPEVATTIAQIACDSEALPQGSPCSPIISELIARILDLRLVQIAKKYKLTYTRYADDITFSTNQKNFPAKIARSNPFNPTEYILGDELIKKINGCGFTINSKKTRMQFKYSRQSVTGLIVNQKVNISNEYYKRARAMCNHLFKSGTYFHLMKTPVVHGTEMEPDFISNLDPLNGIINYIYKITQTEERRELAEQRKNPRSIRKLYNNFLFYKYFINLKQPLIITEGKTDPIYIRSAIRYSPKFHPILGETNKGSFTSNVKYLKYAKLSQEIIGLAGGGAANLKSIFIDYHNNFSKKIIFKHQPMEHPVIILIDNDDVVKEISGICNKLFGKKFEVASTESFYHITRNLYVIKTPEGTPPIKSCIEDLFPSHWLKQPLGGKFFNPTPDISKEYGKDMLANYIIKPNAHVIDFSNFSSLLQRIVDVIEDYAKK